MLKVDEIIDSSGAAPRIETTLRPTPQSVEELTKIYYEIYVPGLCQFFESQWFNFQSQGHNSISVFLHNDPLISLLGSFLVSLHTVNADPNHFSYCGHLETRVVWALAKLAYTIPSGVNMPRDDPLPENNPSETRVSSPRVDHHLHSPFPHGINPLPDVAAANTECCRTAFMSLRHF